MKTDSDIKQDVEAELRWSREIDDAEIAVKVNDGVVTLTGYARNYFEKCRAEAVAKRVAGVAEVADDIEVRLPPCEGLTEPEIALNAVAALKSELPMIWEAVNAVVRQRWITLEGTVEWNYQRERAESAMRRLRGVIGVQNSIRLKPRFAPADIKRQIEQALRRSAEVDAGRVSVETQGSEVTLRGEVRSWAERDQAQATAWSAPGVLDVRNEITVRTDASHTRPVSTEPWGAFT